MRDRLARVFRRPRELKSFWAMESCSRPNFAGFVGVNLKFHSVHHDHKIPLSQQLTPFNTAFEAVEALLLAIHNKLAWLIWALEFSFC